MPRVWLAGRPESGSIHACSGVIWGTRAKACRVQKARERRSYEQDRHDLSDALKVVDALFRDVAAKAAGIAECPRSAVRGRGRHADKRRSHNSDDARRTVPGGVRVDQHLPHRPLKIGIYNDIKARCPELKRPSAAWACAGIVRACCTVRASSLVRAALISTATPRAR